MFVRRSFNKSCVCLQELQQELHQRYMIARAEEKLFKGKVTPELLNTVTEYLLREIHHCTELVLR